MKKELLYLLTGITLAVPAAAQEQSPFSVTAMGSLGASDNRDMMHSAQVRVGYHLSRFSLSLGLNYFTSGFTQDRSDALPQYQYPGPYFEQYTFSHLMVPLTVSYHAPMGSRVEFIPSIGSGLSYNPSSKYETQSSDSSFFRREFTSEEHKRLFRKASVWGTAAIHFSLKVSEPLALLAGATFQGMLTDIYRPGTNANQHNMTLYFDLGARYRF